VTNIERECIFNSNGDQEKFDNPYYASEFILRNHEIVDENYFAMKKIVQKGGTKLLSKLTSPSY